MTKLPIWMGPLRVQTRRRSIGPSRPLACTKGCSDLRRLLTNPVGEMKQLRNLRKRRRTHRQPLSLLRNLSVWHPSDRAQCHPPQIRIGCGTLIIAARWLASRRFATTQMRCLVRLPTLDTWLRITWPKFRKPPCALSFAVTQHLINRSLRQRLAVAPLEQLYSVRQPTLGSRATASSEPVEKTIPASPGLGEGGRPRGRVLRLLQESRAALSALLRLRDLAAYTPRYVREVRLLQMGMGTFIGQGQALLLEHGDAADDAAVRGERAVQSGDRRETSG